MLQNSSRVPLSPTLGTPTVHGHHLTLATTRSPHQLSQLQNSETVQPLNIDIFIKEFDTI